MWLAPSVAGCPGLPGSALVIYPPHERIDAAKNASWSTHGVRTKGTRHNTPAAGADSYACPGGGWGPESSKAIVLAGASTQSRRVMIAEVQCPPVGLSLVVWFTRRADGPPISSLRSELVPVDDAVRCPDIPASPDTDGPRLPGRSGSGSRSGFSMWPGKPVEPVCRPDPTDVCRCAASHLIGSRHNRVVRRANGASLPDRRAGGSRR